MVMDRPPPNRGLNVFRENVVDRTTPDKSHMPIRIRPLMANTGNLQQYLILPQVANAASTPGEKFATPCVSHFFLRGRKGRSLHLAWWPDNSSFFFLFDRNSL
jgi:hypothetical protein